jgi:hypothetical protein
MFIICIGLLSVLMVIPYGAFQVSKARNAEYISNMLAAGAEDLQIGGWNEIVTEKPGVGKADFGKTTTANIHIFDPFVDHGSDVPFKKEDATSFQENMRGKDDLNYILKEQERTEMRPEGSSGKYTYFVTIKPREVTSRKFPGFDANFNIIPCEEITAIKYTTDLLGCYLRVDTDRAFAAVIDTAKTQYYAKAARFRIIGEGKIDFGTTKYVFLTWTDPKIWTTDYSHPDSSIDKQTVTLNCGEWCKIVSAGSKDGATQDITLLTNDLIAFKNSGLVKDLPDSGVQIFVFPGVMYHKRIFD